MFSTKSSWMEPPLQTILSTGSLISSLNSMSDSMQIFRMKPWQNASSRQKVITNTVDKPVLISGTGFFVYE